MNTRTRNFLISLASATVLMLSAALARANTLYVPSQYFRLQAAIDAARPGDMIIVAAGIYNDYDRYSPTVWIGKDLTIRGAGTGRTILMSNGFERCLTTQNLTSASSISGFTFTNGWQAGGGGMLNTNSNLTVNSCEFSYNQAAFGAGLFNDGCNPTISSCTFHNNVAQYGGGGMENQQGSPTVINSVFDTNTAGESGGGIYNYIDSNPKVTNCHFNNHQAFDGGGMANDTSSDPTVANCVFFNNMAFHDGGGIHNNYSSSSTVINCTFTRNSALNNFGSGLGGGICSVMTPGYGPNSATVTNCILWGNTAAAGGNGIYGAGVVTYSDLQDIVSYSTPDRNGNFGADPLFVNAANNNLHLQPGSPCRDRGANTALNAPPFMSIQGTLVDMDLCRRLSGLAVDLGAYEYQSVQDVSSMIKITSNPPSYSNGSYFQILIVTNTGGIHLNGPISLVLNGLKGYTLANGSGGTSALAPARRPYINVAAPLLPGQSIRVALQFFKTGTGTLSYSTQVYDGIGTR